MIAGNKITRTVAGAGVVQLAGPNSRRVGIIISSTSTGKAEFAFGDTPALDDGMTIQSGTMTPLVIIFDKPNDWITQPLNVFCPGAMTVSVVELTDRQP